MSKAWRVGIGRGLCRGFIWTGVVSVAVMAWSYSLPNVGHTSVAHMYDERVHEPPPEGWVPPEQPWYWGPAQASALWALGLIVPMILYANISRQLTFAHDEVEAQERRAQLNAMASVEAHPS